MRVRRFENYAPLNMSLNDLYKEICQTKILPWPKPLGTGATIDRSQICDYYNYYRHKKKNYYDSKTPWNN